MAIPKTQEAAQVASDALLPHQSLSEDSNSTIQFIHSAFADSNDWDLVVPYVRGYHLLLSDCPGHGHSSHISFSIEASAKHIACLIEAQAIGGQAHIVGYSLGASIAVRLAASHPHVVRSLFVFGYSETPVSSALLLSYLLWSSNCVESAVPRPFFAGSWTVLIFVAHLVLRCRFVHRLRILIAVRSDCSRGLHEL
jgi:pimeloyl-ACP methyl ester carboxylesterase